MEQQFTASFIRESESGQLSVATATLTDTNLIRGDGTGEAVTSGSAFQFFNGWVGGPTFSFIPQLGGTPQTGETFVNVTFSDGTVIGGVRALIDVQTGPFALTTRQYLLEAETLDAAGKTLADVTGLQISGSVDHALNWDDFGFVPVGGGTGGGGGGTGPVLNLVAGTAANDRLIGTAGDDLIRGGGDDDRLTGLAGADSFVFGAEARDGDRDRDVITDFTAGVDQIVFEADAQIRMIQERNGNVIIQLEGDRDTIVVQNADLSIQSDFVFADDTFIA